MYKCKCTTHLLNAPQPSHIRAVIAARNMPHEKMSFQSSLETFQCQFCVCDIIGQRVSHDRSEDTEASCAKIMRPGLRYGKVTEVSLCSGSKVGSGPNSRNGDARLTEICWATAMVRVSNEGCNFEGDAWMNDEPGKFIPEHRRDVIILIIIVLLLIIILMLYGMKY